MVFYEPEDEVKKLSVRQIADGVTNQGENNDDSGPVVVSGLEKLDEEAEHREQDKSEPPSDKDETLRSANIPKQTKAVLAKNLNEWSDKIDSLLSKDVGQNPTPDATQAPKKK